MGGSYRTVSGWRAGCNIYVFHTKFTWALDPRFQGLHNLRHAFEGGIIKVSDSDPVNPFLGAESGLHGLDKLDVDKIRQKFYLLHLQADRPEPNPEDRRIRFPVTYNLTLH
jgi:hypothetical protein